MWSAACPSVLASPLGTLLENCGPVPPGALFLPGPWLCWALLCLPLHPASLQMAKLLQVLSQPITAIIHSGVENVTSGWGSLKVKGLLLCLVLEQLSQVLRARSWGHLEISDHGKQAPWAYLPLSHRGRHTNTPPRKGYIVPLGQCDINTSSKLSVQP